MWIQEDRSRKEREMMRKKIKKRRRKERKQNPSRARGRQINQTEQNMVH
jgi:hypothetical protein